MAVADLMTALRNADAAGDTEAATRIAAMIQAQQQPAPAPAQDGPMDSGIGRVLGQTARYGMEGLGTAVGVLSDPIQAMLGAVTGQNDQYKPLGERAAGLADELGLPKAQGKLEKGVEGASKALTGSALTMGAGSAAGASELAAQPLTQAFSSMLGGGVQEATDSPVLGAIASLAPGAKAGLSAVSRGTLRGGDAKGMQDAIQAFEDAGTSPSAGQAAQGGLASGIESLLSKVPGSTGVMARARAGQASDLGAKVSGMADTLAPGSDPVAAGEAIGSGIRGPGGFVDRFKQQASDLYDAVDQHMPGDTPVPMTSTTSLLARLTTPTKGAEATSSILTNPKLAQIAQAVTQDTAANGALPYEAAKSLRTQVGSMLADSGLTSDVPKSQMKRLYGSLSDDLRTATNAAGPDAALANNKAENFYRDGIDQIDKVESVVNQNGGAEAIFRAATSGTKDGATTLANVVNTLKPEEAQVVTSAVMRRMGRATSGNQNDAGDVFSPQTFLTSWNNISPQAKQILFDRMPGTFRSDMDQIAKTASLMKDAGKVTPSPSGSPQGLAQMSAAAGVVGPILTGHPVAAVPVLAALGSTNIAARVMTNPTFVKWLARNTTAPIGVLPAQIAYLDTLGQKNNDPDLSQAAQQISATLGQTQ